jgi:hypothetical protein
MGGVLDLRAAGLRHRSRRLREQAHLLEERASQQHDDHQGEQQADQSAQPLWRARVLMTASLAGPAVSRGRAARPTPPGGYGRCARARARTSSGLVDQLVLLDPGHHRAQLLADLLDGVLGGEAAARVERRRPGAVLDDEVARVLAGLDARSASRIASLVAA